MILGRFPAFGESFPVLVGQDADACPVVVEERVAPTTLDVWLDEVLVGSVLEVRVANVSDQLLARDLEVTDLLAAGLALGLGHGGVDPRVADAVVVAAADHCLRADEDVVEPVLRVVVVGTPAVTEEDVLDRKST